MLKIGDKLLCKKTGKLYNIKKISYIIKDEYYFDWINNFIHLNLNDYYFSLDQNNYYYIWKYFYTPQEIRKLKLKKIKVNRK